MIKDRPRVAESGQVPLQVQVVKQRIAIRGMYFGKGRVVGVRFQWPFGVLNCRLAVVNVEVFKQMLSAAQPFVTTDENPDIGSCSLPKLRGVAQQ